MEKAVFHYDGNGNIVKSFMFCNSKRIDGTSAAVSSEVIDAENLSFVRVAAIGACYIEVGEDPTATNDSLYLAAGTSLIYPVNAGHKISVFGGIANIAKAY